MLTTRRVLLAMVLAITLATPTRAANWSEAYSTSNDVGAWLSDYSLQKADEPHLQQILETGETGVCVSWLSPENDTVRRGIPQPPHPQEDGTILREIEVFDVNGRYVRVLWKRDQYGVWEKQRRNLAYLRQEEDRQIAKEVHGAGAWLMTKEEKRKLGDKVRAEKGW